MFEIKNLILLIGTNPLPNYVVIKYFFKKFNLKTIWLIHSENNKNQKGTYEYAKNIKKLLINEVVNIEFIALRNINSAQEIKRNIEDRFRNIILDGNVHLNYTGGTKSMAVHVYRILEQYFKNNITFSYLDARSSQLVFDNNEFFDNGEDLREIIKVSLDEMIDLHGFKIISADRDDIVFNDWRLEYSNLFDGLIKDENTYNYLKSLSDFINKTYYDSKGFMSTINKFIRKHNLTDVNNVEKIRNCYNSLDNSIKTIIEKLPNEISLLNDEGQLWLPNEKNVNKDIENRLTKSVKGFLHGKWFEYYTYNILFNKVKEIKNIELFMNVKLERNIQNTKDFELDLLIIYGYEVCGISCTTSSTEGEVKLKGVEVIHRVTQFGGDLSKAILITILDRNNVEKMKNDLAIETGTEEGKILVIGIDDFKENQVWDLIKEHIKGEY